jgi:hypothetical protein
LVLLAQVPACGSVPGPPVTDEEKALCLVAADFAHLDFPKPSVEPEEGWTSQLYPGKIRWIVYRYKTFFKGDPNPAFVSTTIRIHPDEGSSTVEYLTEPAVLRWGFDGPFLLGTFDDNHIVPQPIACDYADACHMSFLVKGDTKVGSLFYARKGRFIYRVDTLGWRFLDADECHDFVRPKIERLASFDFDRE